jgi:hypothetical protein
MDSLKSVEERAKEAFDYHEKNPDGRKTDIVQNSEQYK